MEAPQTSSADFKGPLRSLLKFKHFDGFPTACFSKALKCFIIDTADFFFFLNGREERPAWSCGLLLAL